MCGAWSDGVMEGEVQMVVMGEQRYGLTPQIALSEGPEELHRVFVDLERERDGVLREEVW